MSHAKSSRFPLPAQLWDQIGLGLSTLCVIHCLAIPFIASVLPLIPMGETLHEWSHPVFMLLILPTIWLAARRSLFDRRIVGFLVAGFVFLLLGWSVGHYILGELGEAVITTAGSLTLMAGHYFNYKHHRSCKVSSHHHHPHLEQIAHDHGHHEHCTHEKA